MADPAKMDELLQLVRTRRGSFARWRLVTTDTTGRILANEVGLRLDIPSDHDEGNMQIGLRIVEGEVDAVIFLRDPLPAHPYETDFQAVLEVCDVHKVPLATNLASAEILLHFQADHDERVDRVRASLASGRDPDDERAIPLDDDRGVP